MGFLFARVTPHRAGDPYPEVRVVQYLETLPAPDAVRAAAARGLYLLEVVSGSRIPQPRERVEPLRRPRTKASVGTLSWIRCGHNARTYEICAEVLPESGREEERGRLLEALARLEAD